MKHFLASLLLLLLAGSSAFGQIMGKIVDAHDKNPVIGAAVTVKGSSEGTSTDAEGNFKLTGASPTSTLVIHAINYTAQEVAVAGRSNLTIDLAGETKELAEVVVTALGVPRQTRALGYAVQTLDSKQITAVQDPNLVNNFAGKVAGVQITNGGCWLDLAHRD